MSDLVIDTFSKVYTIEKLLQDLDVTNIHKTNVDYVIIRCIFHDDNKPSLSVNTENGSFICFACGESGDLYSFVQKAFRINFKEAKDFLLTKSGLKNGNIENLLFMYEVEKLLKDKEGENITHITPLPKSVIERMYEGKDPYNYLLNRGFSQEDIDYFECGYTEHYNGVDYGINKRITIPGHDEYGNICGFLGRTPLPDVEPKYQNTFKYPKKETLFNLHRAKNYSEKGIILVEGALDAMRVSSLGYKNVAAILGAKLASTQQQLVLKYTNKVYLMFDNDKAGERANFEALKDLSPSTEVYYVQIPDGKKDPGEITNKDELAYLLNTAKSFEEFQMVQEFKKWKKE